MTTGSRPSAADGPASLRVVWVTNDLPPRTGGIQQFVVNLLARSADASTVVLGPALEGDADARRAAAAEDAARPWRTSRAPSSLLPTPARARWLAARLDELRPDVIVIASLWPLGLLASRLRRRTGARLIGLTHGAEAGLARWPVRWLLRACARDVDRITTISDFTTRPIARVLGEDRLVRLAPGVDIQRFAPREVDDEEVAALRQRWGIPPGSLLVGCVARLVPRKGQDTLLAAWPRVIAKNPEARLVIVGDGPMRTRLSRRARSLDSVRVVGPVSWQELPVAYAALDVFAMPVRTRWAGLDVEGLGISFLEAQASGVPVLVGRSGGASETLLDERCGSLVDGRDVNEVADTLLRWLDDTEGRALARQLGPRLVEPWSWDGIAARFRELVASR
jgi:phosphatidylinositol alpha-1,6-mannosyltransferase